MEWGKKDLSESLDLTELENLFHARDDKTLASSKRCCVGVAVWVWLHECGCVGIAYHIAPIEKSQWIFTVMSCLQDMFNFLPAVSSVLLFGSHVSCLPTSSDARE